MRVTIPVTFEVAPVEDEEMYSTVAKEAARLAAEHYLSLVEISDYSTDSESVVVHVDGFGECRVSLVQEGE